MRCEQILSRQTPSADLRCEIKVDGKERRNRAQLTELLGDETSSVKFPNADLGSALTIIGKQYLTPLQLAGLLGISPRTLARWHAIGTGPPRSKVGRLILYDLAKLPAWLESQQIEPAPIQHSPRRTIR
jgi:hypothetical protein